MLGLQTSDNRRFLPLSHLKTPSILLDQNNHDIFKAHIPDQALSTRSVMERQEHFPFSCRDSSCYGEFRRWRFKKRRGKSILAPKRIKNNMAPVAHFSHALNGDAKITKKSYGVDFPNTKPEDNNGCFYLSKCKGDKRPLEIVRNIRKIMSMCAEKYRGRKQD